MKKNFRRIALVLLLVLPTSVLATPVGLVAYLMAGLSSTPFLLSAAVIGATYSFVKLENSDGVTASEKLSIMLNPKMELPNRPEGYGPPPAGSVQATPPTVAAGMFDVYRLSGTTSWYSSQGAACSSQGAFHSCAGYSFQPNGACCRNSDNGNIGGLDKTQQPGCLLGWTPVGDGLCSPMEKPTDGKCTVTRSGNIFVNDPYDPDCLVPPTDGGTTVISGDAKSITATRPDGSKLEVRLQDDGTAVIIDTRATEDGANTQKTTINTSAPNATTGEVTITGKSVTTTAGTGSAATDVPVALPNVNIDTSSLAKEATLGQIRDAVVNPSITGTLGTYETTGDTLNDRLDSFTASLQQLPIVSQTSGFFTVNASGSCPTYTFPATAFFPSVTLDVFCGELVTNIASIVGQVLMVLAAWVAFRWAFL